MSQLKGRERREHVRHLVCGAAEVQVDEKTSVALLRNISITGALIFTRRKLEPGEPVDITVYVSEDETFTTHGEVKRCEGLDPERIGFWGFEAGVEFDEELDHYAEALEKLNASLET